MDPREEQRGPDTNLDAFVEGAEPGQVDEGGLVDGQPDADAENAGPDHLEHEEEHLEDDPGLYRLL